METQADTDVWIGEPGALIRTWEGHITFWSRELEHRYGFPREQAIGQIAHKLLRTTSWQALTEIEAELADQNTWRGGLVHHHADGQPMITANHWHLHNDASDGLLVTELHSDIVSSGPPARDLADVLATMVQGLSEPLTAIGGYVSAVQHALQPAWPDKMRANQAIDRAIEQLARARETLTQMRAIGRDLKNPQQRELHARLTATMEQAERSMREFHAVVATAGLTGVERK